MKHKMPHIKNIMTPFPFTVETSATLAEARSMMTEHKIRHLPVSENHVPVGIVSERDLNVSYSLGAHVMDTAEISVGMVCTRDPYVVDLHATVADVATEMAERHIGSALVVKDGKLAGIFTTTDACRFIGELLNDLYGPKEPEAA